MTLASKIWVGAFLILGVCGLGCGPTSDGFSNADGGGGGDVSAVDAAEPSFVDATSPDTGGALGSACACDTDCPADGSHAGLCVMGICMTQASADCSAGGSTAECGAGSRCWGLQSQDGSICWPDCDSYACDGFCDGDGSCVANESSDCTYSCSDYCVCQPGDCQSGESCVSGQCVPEVSGAGPGPGPGPACANLPPRDCTGTAAFCSQLVQFNPSLTPHYDDYAINGESANNQYRSWIRRDLSMLIEYATAKTLCKTEAWQSGIGGALGLGDMSEPNGAIPGTSVGQPGHPANTHTNGSDIDLAYYQMGQVDNRLRPICEHTTNGVDQYHCVSEPTGLDAWRHAFFLGTVFESDKIRVIGVDGQVGPQVTSNISQLCTSGWLSGLSCGTVPLAYETTNMNQGWFEFHHHHSHLSWKTQGIAPFGTSQIQCLKPGCPDLKAKPRILHTQ